jgi:hypothetical protein
LNNAQNQFAAWKNPADRVAAPYGIPALTPSDKPQRVLGSGPTACAIPGAGFDLQTGDLFIADVGQNAIEK